MLKHLRMLFKICRLTLGGKLVNAHEFGEEYDTVSATYDRWLERMGQHVDRMLDQCVPLVRDGERVLDLACGNSGSGMFSNNQSEVRVNLSIFVKDLSFELSS
mgnify:CR=1 FL=1